MMKRNTLVSVVRVLTAALLITSPPAYGQQPNVIVIVADDAGYADFGFMDGLSGTTSVVPTPNLDALASSGVTFSRAYVGQSCAPTRAALVTGGYQNRIGNEVVGNNLTSANGVFEGVPVESETIWERMKSVGYSTGAVGKWHLGQIEDTPQQIGNRPQRQGVDDFFGIWHGSRTYNVGNTNLVQTQLLREATVDTQGNITDTVVEADFAGEYITNTFGDAAIDFIAERHDDADPFFLYQSFTAPHTPLGNSPDFNDPRLAGLSGIQKQYASMMLTMDNEVGRIVDRLADPNGDGNTADSIADNTMIMFVNDNGGADEFSSSPNGADNGVLRRGKGSPYEGGIRVPMFIAGAGVAPSAQGTVYSKPVHGVDILPTAFAAGGGTFAPSETGIDGTNLLPYINGDVAGNPHEVIVHRHRTMFAVIKGDWKLVSSSGSPTTNYQLYNVATDISEQQNVANVIANEDLVAELTRDLTEYESQFDKQRFAILGRTAEETINLFDHFTFNPGDGGLSGEKTIIGGPVGDGDFEAAGGSGPQPYTASSSWFNASGSEGFNFTNDSQTNGSSQPGSRAGMPFQNRTQVNNTGHVIGSAGEVFDLSYDFGAGGALANWNGDETMRLFLFTTGSAVDGNLTAGDITILAEESYSIDRAGDGQWTTRDADAFYTSIAGDVGKEVFLGMVFEDASGPTLFPRIDVIELLANGAGGPSDPTINWSAGGAWFEGGTSNVETMFTSDAFAGAVLEFTTTDDISYVSNNDMTRSTGQAYMLNRILLSGSFNGTENESGTIQGNAVLLTDSLEGVSPGIDITASNNGVQTFAFQIDLDLVLYDDATISGDGDATVTINGAISDYFEARGIQKTGTSTVSLTGENTYSGNTLIEGGTLALIDSGTIANTAVIDIQAGALLDVSQKTTGSLTLNTGQTLQGTGEVQGDIVAADGSTVSPGNSPGELSLLDDFTLQSGATILFELEGAAAPGADYDQLDVAGAVSLDGGDIEVILSGGFVPSSGDIFDVLDFGSISGSLGNLSLPALPGGLSWDASQLLSTGELRVEGGVAGDFNGDGKVDNGDLNLLLGSWGSSTVPPEWVNGFDSPVDNGELNALLGNWGFGTTTAVPEPVSSVSLGLLIGLLAARRR